MKNVAVDMKNVAVDMKNVAVDMKNVDMVKNLDEATAKLRVVGKENDIERALLRDISSGSGSDNDMLNETKVWGVLAEFLNALKKDAINIYKFLQASEIARELEKNAEHFPKESIIKELIEEIRANEQFTAEEKAKLEAQMQDPANQEKMANIVNSNMDRFNGYLSANLHNLNEEGKEKLLDDGYRKTQLNEEDILDKNKDTNRDEDKSDNKDMMGDKQSVSSEKQSSRAESRASRMRKG